MDSFEINKIAGCVLGTLLFTMGLSIISEGLFAHPHMDKPGYALPAAAESHGGPAAAAVPDVPLPVLLAKADAKKGEAAAKACTTCHTLAKGEADKPTGPNLAGIVGRKMGSTGFAGYSDGMKAKGDNWSYESLNAFITSPKALFPNTRMTYPGERDPARRADIIAFLRSITDGAPALPAP